MAMSVGAFIEKLSRTRAKWRIDSTGSIRTNRGRHCPLSYVAKVDGLDGLTASEKLELPYHSYVQIVNAADLCIGHAPTLRRALEEACRIK